MIEQECPACKELLEAAQGAVVRHIDTLSKLRMAHTRFEHDAIPALRAAVEEAQTERERTMSELRRHFATHPEEGIRRSANPA